jgi:hypothetical protein
VDDLSAVRVAIIESQGRFRCSLEIDAEIGQVSQISGAAADAGISSKSSQSQQDPVRLRLEPEFVNHMFWAG